MSIDGISVIDLTRQIERGLKSMYWLGMAITYNEGHHLTLRLIFANIYIPTPLT
jgi:hypothetical protein